MVVCVFPILGRSPEDLELFSLTLDLLFRIVCSTVGVRYSVDWTSLMNIPTVDGLRLLLSFADLDFVGIPGITFFTESPARQAITTSR